MRKIRKLYLIEKTSTQPTLLEGFKRWLNKNVTGLVKGSLTDTALEYDLNQWPTLASYCDNDNTNTTNSTQTYSTKGRSIDVFYIKVTPAN